MTVNEYVAWFLLMAVAILAILVVGTFAAAGILKGSPHEGREEPAGDQGAAARHAGQEDRR